MSADAPMPSNRLIHGYGKVWNLSHSAVRDLFLGPVEVQEKVDGSQFSFGVDATTGELICRSKGADAIGVNLFAPSVDHATQLHQAGKLVPGWVYRGEALQKPRHNALTYSRVPHGHIALFDVEHQGEGSWVPHHELEAIAEALGVEAVPHFGTWPAGTSYTELQRLLERESFLGGVLVEGVVIKARGRFGVDGKPLMGKLVRPEFRELNKSAHGKEHIHAIIHAIARECGTPERWAKVVQHLRERGELEGSPRDIGKLCEELHRDIEVECKEHIGQRLMEWALKDVKRGALQGFPDWYKTQLLLALEQAK
jgi:RNA ligase-like protein